MISTLPRCGQFFYALRCRKAAQTRESRGKRTLRYVQTK
jgi:hypothetical protein